MSEPWDIGEAEALIQGYLEGDLSDHDAARLHTLLEREPALAKALLEALHTDALLREGAVAGSVTGASPAVRTSAKPPTRRIPVEFVAPTSAMSRPLSRTRRFAVVAMVLVATAIVGWRWWSANLPVPRIARISHPEGVAVMREGQRVMATPGMKLQSGDRVDTGPESGLTMSFAHEETELTIEPDSGLTLSSWRRGKRFELTRGRVLARVATQPAGRPMVLGTPDSEVRVLGTEFGLGAAVGGTTLDVWEGRVRLTRRADGAHVEAPAGQTAVTEGLDLGLQPIGDRHPPGIRGGVEHEYWLYLPGSAVSNLTGTALFPARPHDREIRSALELPADWDVFHGSRLRAWLYPPMTGQYTFWVAADDAAQLWLSHTESPDHRVRIVEVGEATGFRQWDRAPSQHSAAVRLRSGHRYYIELLHKQAAAPGGVSVAWTRPDGVRERIPGALLAPYRSALHVAGGEREATR